MADRGAPEGNSNASKGRLVEQMIKRALMRDDYKRLHQGVERLLDQVADGERWALEFVTDRLDGKPKQAVELSGDVDSPLVMLVQTAEEMRKKIRGEK